MMSKIKQIAGWQLRYALPSVGIFYAVIALVYVTFGILISVLPEGEMSYGGSSFSTCVFLFVCGIIYCRECLHFGLANGVSRRSIFAGYIVSGIILDVGMSLVSVIAKNLFVLAVGPQGSMEPFDFIYSGSAIYQTFLGFWGEVLFLTGFGLLALMIGYLVSMFNYRSGKLLKVLVWATFGFVCFLVPTLLATLLSESAKRALGAFFGKVGAFFAATPVNAFLLGFGIAAILGVCCWLFVRRVPLKTS